VIYWAVSLAALIGVVLNIKKHVGCFAIWAVTNAFWVYADLKHGLPSQAALMAVYFLLSLWGLWKWSAREKGAPHGEKASP